MRPLKNIQKTALKKGFVFLLTVWIFIFVFLGNVWSQSTMEYGALISAVGGGAAGSKKSQEGQEDEEEDSGAPGVLSSSAQKFSAQTAELLSKGGSLLGQVGGGVALAGDRSEAPGAEKTARQEEIVEPKGTQSVAAESPCKVYLRSGRVIEGKLVEKGRESVRVDSEGIVVTYFNEEIDKILVL